MQRTAMVVLGQVAEAHSCAVWPCRLWAERRQVLEHRQRHRMGQRRGVLKRRAEPRRRVPLTLGVVVRMGGIEGALVGMALDEDRGRAVNARVLAVAVVEQHWLWHRGSVSGERAAGGSSRPTSLALLHPVLEKALGLVVADAIPLGRPGRLEVGDRKLDVLALLEPGLGLGLEQPVAGGCANASRRRW
jgi:hypothetical protein